MTDLADLLKRWRNYTDADFDGLAWPVEEFRQAAEEIDRLSDELRVALTGKGAETADGFETELRKE